MAVPDDLYRVAISGTRYTAGYLKPLWNFTSVWYCRTGSATDDPLDVAAGFASLFTAGRAAGHLVTNLAVRKWQGKRVASAGPVSELAITGNPGGGTPDQLPAQIAALVLGRFDHVRAQTRKWVPGIAGARLDPDDGRWQTPAPAFFTYLGTWLKPVLYVGGTARPVVWDPGTETAREIIDVGVVQEPRTIRRRSLGETTIIPVN